MALGLSLAPRRFAGSVMSTGALGTALLLSGAGAATYGSGASISLALIGPMMDLALRRARTGGRSMWRSWCPEWPRIFWRWRLGPQPRFSAWISPGGGRSTAGGCRRPAPTRCQASSRACSVRCAGSSSEADRSAAASRWIDRRQGGHRRDLHRHRRYGYRRQPGHEPARPRHRQGAGSSRDAVDHLPPPAVLRSARAVHQRERLGVDSVASRRRDSARGPDRPGARGDARVVRRGERSRPGGGRDRVSGHDRVRRARQDRRGHAGRCARDRGAGPLPPRGPGRHRARGHRSPVGDCPDRERRRWPRRARPRLAVAG